jgi:hypothetical protein
MYFSLVIRMYVCMYAYTYVCMYIMYVHLFSFRLSVRRLCFPLLFIRHAQPLGGWRGPGLDVGVVVKSHARLLHLYDQVHEPKP